MVLRNSLKEMMTPELAARTLQLYTGLMEDFFGLPARAPEVRLAGCACLTGFLFCLKCHMLFEDRVSAVPAAHMPSVLLCA